jgi:hypothetical protein
VQINAVNEIIVMVFLVDLRRSESKSQERYRAEGAKAKTGAVKDGQLRLRSKRSFAYNGISALLILGNAST